MPGVIAWLPRTISRMCFTGRSIASESARSSTRRGTRNFSRKTWPGWVRALDMASAERLIRLQHFLANLR